MNLYAPSTAEWPAAGVKLAMETDFPEGESATLKLTVAAPKEFTIAVRRPFWAGDGFSVKVNGEAVAADESRRGSVRRHRRPPRSLRPDAAGQFVRRTPPHLEDRRHDLRSLAEDAASGTAAGQPAPRRHPVGPARAGGRSRAGRTARDRNTLDDVPVFVAAERPVADWLKPVPGQPGCFRTEGVGRDRDVDFVPFYRLHRRTYGIYWDLFTPPEWDKRAAEIAAEREKQRKLEAATVGYVQPGEMQAERDANMQGESTEPVRVMGRPGRRGIEVVLLRPAGGPGPSADAGGHLQPRRVAGPHV